MGTVQVISYIEQLCTQKFKTQILLVMISQCPVHIIYELLLDSETR
jgi:hypothetical protein